MSLLFYSNAIYFDLAKDLQTLQLLN